MEAVSQKLEADGEQRAREKGDFIYNLGENHAHIIHEWTLFTFFKFKIWKKNVYYIKQLILAKRLNNTLQVFNDYLWFCNTA